MTQKIILILLTKYVKEIRILTMIQILNEII